MFFKEIIEEQLAQKIIGFSHVSGGCINQVFKINTARASFVIKINTEKRYPKMFEKEHLALISLSDTGIKTPKVMQQFKHADQQFLVLEFIEEEKRTTDFSTNFAIYLAKLHQKESSFFGLDDDNYIGSLVQINSKKETWEKFFIENRISPLIKKAFDLKLLHDNHIKMFENLFKQLKDILPQEKASFLHGDLWSGNVMTGKNQIPVFIDPAVYFGNREMDLAMTQLFGGFEPAFIEKYNEIFTLQPGWKERIEIHNLYPVLVHLMLFGSPYLSAIERVIKKYKAY